MRPKAFTLVELLVVIGIITLLLAILTPSMTAAKRLARSTLCMTNLNALTKSVLVYAEVHRGYMMVWGHTFYTIGENDYIEAPARPALTTVAFTSGMGLNPVTGLYADTRGYGLLYLTGYVNHVEMFYCPGTREDERYDLAHYPKPWGSGTVEGSRIHTGYMWDPWVRVLEGSGDDVRVTYEDNLLLERHPTDQFLQTDLIMNEETISHRIGNKIVWNHAYIDAHVESHEYPDLQELFASGFDASGPWEPYQDQVRPEVEGN